MATSSLNDWLTAHPLIQEDRKRTNAARTIAAENALREKANEERVLGGGGASWHGKFPMSRLIYALVDHDNIKSAYLTHHDLPSGCMAVENRNTIEARMGTVWQMLNRRILVVSTSPLALLLVQT